MSGITIIITKCNIKYKLNWKEIKWKFKYVTVKQSIQYNCMPFIHNGTNNVWGDTTSKK